ncbi:MAG: DNA internalization-related competence protein ComEC/Rec2 [Archangium sp.]|nr:DNA internalization-related competence protein ComEC/Rec2 [Archangium sp.]
MYPGQRVVVETRLRPIRPASNPGEWSRAEALRRRGFVATGSFDETALVVASEPSAWRTWMGATHRALAEAATLYEGDPQAAALFLTLAAGQRAQLEPLTEDEFARSGLAHVLSVSGLHVAVLALVLLAVLRWVMLRLPLRALQSLDVRRVAAPAAIPLVWLYVAFTGFQAPAIRSAVMSTVLLAGVALMRRGDALNALAVAAAVMTFIDPSTPFELSVQLSFLSVGALILLAPMLRRAIPLRPATPIDPWPRRALEVVLQSVVASLAATAVTAPLIALVFQRVSLAGVLSNVVTLPLCGVLTVVSALAAAVFVASPALAAPLVWAGVQLADVLLRCARWFANVPGAAVEIPAPPLSLVVGWLLCLLAIVLLTRRWRALGVAGLALLGWLMIVPTEANTTDVTFLSVGHGDAIVVSSRGHHALIDGGGNPHGADPGRKTVLPFLKQRGIRSLDLAVLSHPHPDHALGLASTLRELPVKRLWLPAGATTGTLIEEVTDAADEAEVEAIEVGHAPVQLGDVRIEVLGPPADRALLEGENDRSIVLRVRHGEVTFLLTGDVEEAAEAVLTAGPATVLKVPHHGSRTSSTPRFVEETHPRYAVFSVGLHNRFGFPNGEVVERYESVGAQMLRTDLDGAITFHSDGRDVTVDTFHPRRERARLGSARQAAHSAR